MKQKQSSPGYMNCIETAKTIPANTHAIEHEPKTNTLLTREEIAQFKELALQEYGVTLTDEQAYEQATAFLTLFDTLLEKHLAFGHQNDMMTDR